jgi:hypothetical protein
MKARGAEESLEVHAVLLAIALVHYQQGFVMKSEKLCGRKRCTAKRQVAAPDQCPMERPLAELAQNLHRALLVPAP